MHTNRIGAHVHNGHDVNIKYFVRLKVLIKKFTTDHIKKKPHMFRYEEIHEGVTILFLDTNSENL